MTDHHDAQDYTANGPTGIGFRTGGDGTGIAKGVVASGTALGVHGIGLGLEGSAAESIGVYGESHTGTGVKGYGNFYGVFGVTNTGGAGVKGSSSAGPGVVGLGSPGVLGEGITGVRGNGQGSVDDDTVGVYGESLHGAGVFGNSDIGAGIQGESRKGPGIHGRSDEAYGGVFASNFAQMRLRPADLLFGPPQGGAHKMGDFFVDGRGALFYCSGGSPPRWEQLAGPSWFSDIVYKIINLLPSRK